MKDEHVIPMHAVLKTIEELRAALARGERGSIQIDTDSINKPNPPHDELESSRWENREAYKELSNSEEYKEEVNKRMINRRKPLNWNNEKDEK